ncbi:MAG: hypothetical protein EB127_01590 [Alphaproteobacteria bacterium]|nr:hypothetical protein [Alphaproteobacteria bacterium]
MELIDVKDLDVGDEILVSCQSCFKYLRLLRKPVVSPTKKHWSTGQPMYKSVKCSTIRNTVDTTWTRNGNTYTRTTKEWGFGPDDHNHNHFVDLNYRQIILVKKNK